MGELGTLQRRRRRLDRFHSFERLLFYGPPEDLSLSIKPGMISVGDYVLWKARWQRVSAVTDSDFRTERGERIEFNQRIHNEFQRQRMSPLPIQILSLILAGSAAVVAALSLIAALFGLWLQWTQKP